MRLLSFAGKYGVTRLGVFTEKGVVDLSASAQDSGSSAETFQSMVTFLDAGGSARVAAEGLVKDVSQTKILALDDVRLLAPVPRPGKIVAVRSIGHPRTPRHQSPRSPDPRADSDLLACAKPTPPTPGIRPLRPPNLTTSTSVQFEALTVSL